MEQCPSNVGDIQTGSMGDFVQREGNVELIRIGICYNLRGTWHTFSYIAVRIPSLCTNTTVCFSWFMASGMYPEYLEVSSSDAFNICSPTLRWRTTEGMHSLDESLTQVK